MKQRNLNLLVFVCLFFFKALVPVASWDLEVPIDVVDVNCQNLPIMVYQDLSIPESVLACSTYLSLLSSPVAFAQLFSVRFPYYLGSIEQTTLCGHGMAR